MLIRNIQSSPVLRSKPSDAGISASTWHKLMNLRVIRPAGNNRCCTYSPDGRWFAWASTENVHIADPLTGEVVTTLPTANVYEIGFSPRGNFVITWQRPTKQEDGAAHKNLKVWQTQTAEHVVEFVQKSQTGWNLQWTYDEKYCARAVTNEIQVFESSDMSTVWGHLRVEGVADFALSPGKNYSIAVFVPERKGNPAMVKVFQIPNWKTVLSQKSFYKADRVQLKWNNIGTAVLVFAQTDADKTGKSYYGETNLYLITVTGNYDCRVQLDKEGPIHDVTWSTDSKEFGVVYGFMPAKTTLFDSRANVVHQLPSGPRNTIVFSPHARFVLVAGFGNLQGEIDVYDRQAGMRKLTTINSSNPSICEWSPDGRHILTATTSPRLRVDNGVMIWHYTGELMYKLDMEELYHVTWRPQPVSAFPLPNPLPAAPAPHESAKSHVSTATPKKAAGAYRPPHARGSETPLHFKREDEGGASHIYANGGGPPRGGMNGFGRGGRLGGGGERLVPGAAPGGGVSLAGTGTGADEESGLSKTALKNKKKREAAKKAKADAINGGSSPDGDREGRQNLKVPGGTRSRSRTNGQQGRGRSKSRSRDGPPKDAPTGPKKMQEKSQSPKIPEPEVPQDDKKVRGLLKKLRAIEELKQRLGKGEKLEDTQLKKIKTEDGVKKELEALGVDGSFV
ncbi:eukaryotic translation initiation factor eIF2A-domain-containing protein [Geopyxis carbonaria]|nr:eukaryotic translation initiation factor eIF2A-domain-containing protein [Geopyxis carbonaria]